MWGGPREDMPGQLGQDWPDKPGDYGKEEPRCEPQGDRKVLASQAARMLEQGHTGSWSGREAAEKEEVRMEEDQDTADVFCPG
jgi:hypothetical protein